MCNKRSSFQTRINVCLKCIPPRNCDCNVLYKDALFKGLIFRFLRHFRCDKIISSIPFIPPLCLCIIIIVLWKYTNTSTIASRMDVNYALVFSGFILGVLALLKNVFVNDLISQETLKQLEKDITILLETRIELTTNTPPSGDTDSSIITSAYLTVHSSFLNSIKGLEVSLRELKRIVEWSQRTIFIAVFCSVIIYTAGDLLESALIYELAFITTLALLILFLFLSFASFFPGYIKYYIRTGKINTERTFITEFRSIVADIVDKELLVEKSTMMSRIEEKLRPEE